MSISRRHAPRHDKTDKMSVRPAKTQISLGIRPVWSEHSVSACRGSLATHWPYSGDSNQTGRMLRLIWVFAGRTCHFVGFVMRRLTCCDDEWSANSFNEAMASHSTLLTKRSIQNVGLIISLWYCGNHHLRKCQAHVGILVLRCNFNLSFMFSRAWDTPYKFV